MSHHTLEDRVATLEQTVQGLVDAAKTGKQEKDWRSTVGMFEGDPVMARFRKKGGSSAKRNAAQPSYEY